MLQHQCENYTIDRSDKVEDKEIKKEEANVAEEVTRILNQLKAHKKLAVKIQKRK